MERYIIQKESKHNVHQWRFNQVQIIALVGSIIILLGATIFLLSDFLSRYLYEQRLNEFRLNYEKVANNLNELNERLSIMDGKINVIISDGFTGNIALKTAEGTANFIVKELKNAMTGSLLGKISSILNYYNLKKFKNRLDPRLYNGAIFLGLDSPVVKSHGGTDFIGFSNSLDVCNKIVKGNLIEKIKFNI